jgi:hypothetical protein
MAIASLINGNRHRPEAVSVPQMKLLLYNNQVNEFKNK